MWYIIENWLKHNAAAKISCSKCNITYGEMLQTIVLHGDELKKTLKPKSKCAILCDQGLNTAIGILSCFYANMVAIPMSLNYGSEHCEKIINLVKPHLIIADYKCEMCDYYYNLNNKEFNCTPQYTYSEEALNDVALIMCTSGTTGNPKGAMITEDGLIKNVQAISKYFLIDNKDTILIARPLYHCAVLTGEFMLALSKGVNIVFADSKYHPTSILAYAKKYFVTTICGTPTMINHIARLNLGKTDNLCVKNIVISGECLNKNAAKSIREAFNHCNIYSVYGLTEAAPRVTYLPTDKFDEYSESVGIPLEDVSIKIMDMETLQENPRNCLGVVFVSSPSIMKGYYKDLKLTNTTIVDGWLNTRDYGYIDDKGYLYIVGRIDDLIIKAGMNISPKEIESKVITLPEVVECLAYAVNEPHGVSIGVDIVLHESYLGVDKKTIMQKLRDIMPAYLLPSKLSFVESISQNASGKIIRYKKSINT